MSAAACLRGCRLALAVSVDADDLGVKDHVAADEPLTFEYRLTAMQPRRLGDQDEPVARANLTTETDVFHAPEADESLSSAAGYARREAAKLRRGLAHQHAGHERVIRHMAAHPELIGPTSL